MKQPIIIPAVFAYTLYIKFQDPRTLAPLLCFVFLPITLLIVPQLVPHDPFTPETKKQIADSVGGYFNSPAIGMLIAYLFISDGPAGRKLVAEADSLALLFTRPLTRFSYVLSKFCAGVIGSTVTLSLGLLATYIVGSCIGINQIDIGPLVFASLLCNSASWASLFVFFHSAAPVAAILVYIFLLGASGMGDIFTRAEMSTDPFIQNVTTVTLFIYKWFGDILPTPIYLPTVLSAASFDMYEIAIFVSNISLFLLLATFALSKREFSYGSD